MSTPSTAWKERVPPGEEARLERLAEQLRDLQKVRAAKTGGVAARGLHAKGHLGARATIEVRDDLPEHARHGLFAKSGARFDAWVRFSNGAGMRQHDRVGDVRGMAIKVLGVPGKKIIPGMEDEETQDLLLIGAPATPFKDADEFVALVLAAAGSPALLLPRFARAVGLFRAVALMKKLVAGISKPFPTFAGQALHSALPICVGPYAAKYSLLPSGTPPPADGAGRSLAEDLSLRLAKGPLTWDLALQFFTDEATTPIEDASVEWTGPFVKVARFEIPRQDTGNAEGRALTERVEALSFDPWHALVEHRPLGQMMRARNHAYRLSTQARGAAPEPRGTVG